MAETVWPAKPKRLTVWPFEEKCTNPYSSLHNYLRQFSEDTGNSVTLDQCFSKLTS